MMSAPPPAPAGAKPVKCPMCGRHLGVVEGSYFDAPPCKNCGWQTIVRAESRRATREIETMSGRIEIKSRPS